MVDDVKRYVKVMNPGMKNRRYQFRIGLNIDSNTFDPTMECGNGIYFCEWKDAFYWAYELGYTHVCDIEIPKNAQIAHFTGKSKTDKILILNEPIPLSEHEMWIDPKICMSAVTYTGGALQYVREQTPKICLAAVRKNAWALRFVDKQTPEICLAAVKKGGIALRFVDKQTPEICLAAVQQDGLALQYVQEQTPGICLAAVQQDGNALGYVQEQTPGICLAAVRQNNYAIEYVRDRMSMEVFQTRKTRLKRCLQLSILLVVICTLCLVVWGDTTIF